MNHLLDASLYMQLPGVKIDSADIKKLQDAFSVGYPAASKVFNATGPVLSVEDIDSMMSSITFDNLMTEPEYRFESRDGVTWAIEDRGNNMYNQYYRAENGFWAYGDRKKTCYVDKSGNLNKWLNNQLAQYLLKMTVLE